MNQLLQEQLYETMDNSRDFLTIVEGKNDKRALERFGFSNIRTLNKALFKVVEEIDAEEVIILTDLDAYGKKLYHYFFTECNKRGIKVNNRLRQILHFSELRQIEGLPKYLERIA
ncbi:toprim domain-containing protein [Candidatus Woesearchaeota archaeon]|nr:toprim domain-containing protein [Candidatus Woesearchaeota archaeon]